MGDGLASPSESIHDSRKTPSINLHIYTIIHPQVCCCVWQNHAPYILFQIRKHGLSGMKGGKGDSEEEHLNPRDTETHAQNWRSL